MTLEEMSEKSIKNSRLVIDGEYFPLQADILDKGEDFLLTLIYAEKDDNPIYTIYYKIDENFYSTVSSLYAMKKGSSILTTKRLVQSEHFAHIIEQEDVFIASLDDNEQKKFDKHLNFFMNYLSKHPLVRVRNKTGNYGWFIQDADGRRKIKKDFI